MKKLGNDLLDAMENRTHVTVVVTLADGGEVDPLAEILEVLFQVDIAGLKVSETKISGEILLVGLPIDEISRLAARKEIKGIRLG